MTVDEPYVKSKKPESLEVWRKYNVWATLMAGGAVSELYLGGGKDLTEQNIRLYEQYYKAMATANRFFHQHLPFWEMEPVPNALENGWLLAKENQVYAVYLPEGGEFNIDLPEGQYYNVEWFSPTEEAFDPKRSATIKCKYALVFKHPKENDVLCLIRRKK